MFSIKSKTSFQRHLLEFLKSYRTRMEKFAGNHRLSIFLFPVYLEVGGL